MSQHLRTITFFARRIDEFMMMYQMVVVVEALAGRHQFIQGGFGGGAN